MKVLEKFQVFCAEYVGMIRAKIPLIHKLRDCVFDTGNEKKELLRTRRLHDQDDMLFRCEDSGELVSTGNYVRTESLLGATELHLERQKREYGRKERICKLNGKPTIDFVNDSEETLETENESDVDLAEHELDNIHDKQTQCIDESKRLMDDVKLELTDVSNIMNQFREIRRIDYEKYKSAYVALSLPGKYIFMCMYVFVRCEHKLQQKCIVRFM